MIQIKLNKYKELKKVGTIYIECGRFILENKCYGQDFNLDKTKKSVFANIYRKRFGNSAYIKSLLKNYKKYDYVNALSDAKNSKVRIQETGAIKLEYDEFEKWQNENGIFFENKDKVKDAYFYFLLYKDTSAPNPIWY